MWSLDDKGACPSQGMFWEARLASPEEAVQFLAMGVTSTFFSPSTRTSMRV